MGCYRSTHGECYFVGGRVENKDYGDKEGYRLDAWKEAPGRHRLVHAATLFFFVSRSALATARIRQLLDAEPTLLKQLALGRIKRMLDTGNMKNEILLTTESPETDFEIDDPSGDPLIGQQNLRAEILRELALRHSKGEKAIRYEIVRDQLCATDDWIQRALRLLDAQKFISGTFDGNLRLTDEGYLAAENVLPPTSKASAVTSPVNSLEKPMDCFLSYAGEDRDIAIKLVNALTSRGIQVWWDRGQITLGDRLTQRINEGLRLSRYGLIMVSSYFIAKDWPQSELAALHTIAMTRGGKVILPVLIGLKHTKFAETYPLLADLVSTEFSGDIDTLADEIIRAIK